MQADLFWLRIQAAYHLLIAASQATNAREKVKGKVVEKWLGACAGAFAKGERFSEAAELYEQLNDLKNAKKMYLAMRSYGRSYALNLLVFFAGGFTCHLHIEAPWMSS